MGNPIPDGTAKLLAGKIVITSPGGNRRQIRDEKRAVDCILFHGKKLDGAPPFPQSFLSPSESSVD